MHACSAASVMSDSVTLWMIAHQALLSMGFSRQEHWSGLPCPSPGDLPDPGIEPISLISSTFGGGSFSPRATWEAKSVSVPEFKPLQPMVGTDSLSLMTSLACYLLSLG